MFAWLENNAMLVSALASLATVVIWMLYLQLFYRNYRIQERPHLIIKQGYGFDLETPCYVSNMSRQAVDVMAVLIRAERGGAQVTFAAAESSDRSPESRAVVEPLRAGSFLRLGTFRGLLERADVHLPGEVGASSDGETILEVRVVALVGAQQVPRGARRRFRISPGKDERHVRPVDVLPDQLASSRQRRLARQWLEQAQELEAKGPRRE